MNFVKKAQKYLKELHLDGWLLYDFRKTNELAHICLKIPDKTTTTRRFFYLIPKKEKPIKLVHGIEPHILDAHPGQMKMYTSWQSLEEQLADMLRGKRRVAMEYSPNNTIPYVSRVDAGTVDQIRSFGVEVVSSADFLAQFTSTLSPRQIESQIQAGKALDRILQDVWAWIAQLLTHKKTLREYDVQQKIIEEFTVRHMVTDHPPIVGVNAHSADPHYQPLKSSSSVIQMGDLILIDLWAKEKREDAIFADITRVAVAAHEPSEKQKKIFGVVRKAQLRALELIQECFQKKQRIEGWEVDDAAREVVQAAGFGKYFTHRTGHSIERTLHGSGAHIDNLETHDIRPLIPGSCFSIEPGIYLPGEFGIRLETDVLIHYDGSVQITGGQQEEITSLY